MNLTERTLLAAVMFGIAMLMSFDMISDYKRGADLFHLVSEGFVAVSAVIGLFFLLRGQFILRQKLKHEIKNAFDLKVEADKWRTQAKKYLEGLSYAVDLQLTKWNLTSSEKEVAFLLLKGLSLKEIADIRHTTEKTARTQSGSIYAKSGLSGRSELAAFFLEDLLVPGEEIRD